MKMLILKHHIGDDGKNHQGDAFLNHLQLNQRKRTAVTLKADTIGWHLTTILKEGDEPRKSDDTYQRSVGGCARLLEFQVAVPR